MLLYIENDEAPKVIEPTDDEMQEMYAALEEEEEMEMADESDWREEIWRDHVRTESRSIAREMARYR